MVAAFPYRTDVVNAATSYDLTRLDAVIAEIGGQFTDAEKDWLSERIRQMSKVSVTYSNREFAQETLKDAFRLDDESRSIEKLWLTRDPVDSITSVVEDGVTLTATDYELIDATGELYRLDGNDNRSCWARAKTVVTYVGGYVLLDTLPRDIERAVISLVKLAWFQKSQNPLVKSEEVPGILSQQFWLGSLPGSHGGLPPEVTSLLDPYRRITF